MYLIPSELESHLYGEVVNEIDRSNVTIAESAIDAAIEEVRGYLSNYNVEAIFKQEKEERNAILLLYTKDVSVWHFIQLCNPGIDLALRQLRYEQAIKWLDKVQRGMVIPNLPPIPATLDENGNTIPSETNITWGSKPKRQNNY